jgi:cyclopropane fatty-acyl-phospholipid synthase-like methyltransferase
MTDHATRAHPGHEGPTRPGALYATPPPWDIGRPQPAFLALAGAGAIRGRVLDVGCGTGEHVLMAAGLGLEATGVDVAAPALDIAAAKAHDRGLPARFLLHDALRLDELGESLDTVLDCGLFHVFQGDALAAYVAGLRSVLVPGGAYFMLCCSDRERGGWARRHARTESRIRAAFAWGWRVESLERATIDVTTDPAGVRAWLVALTRTSTTDRR